jgi:hypothetical protein
MTARIPLPADTAEETLRNARQEACVLEFQSIPGRSNPRPRTVLATLIVGTVLAALLIAGALAHHSVTHTGASWGSSFRSALGKISTAFWRAPSSFGLKLAIFLIMYPALFAVQRRSLIFGPDGLSLRWYLPRWLTVGALRGWTISYAELDRLQLVFPWGVTRPGPRGWPAAALVLPAAARANKQPVRIAVAHWQRPGNRQPPRVAWRTPWGGRRRVAEIKAANRGALECTYESLALIQELRRRGVAIPSWSEGISGNDETDLLRDAKMRRALPLFIGLSIAAITLMLVPREQWIRPPSMTWWIGLGTVFTIGAGTWMLRDTAISKTAAVPMGGPSKTSVWERLIVTFLLGAALTGAVWSLLPWTNRALFPATQVSYCLRRQPLAPQTLVPVDGQSAEAPDIVLPANIGIWFSLRTDVPYVLKIRRGLGGWQYDASGLVQNATAADTSTTGCQRPPIDAAI